MKAKRHRTKKATTIKQEQDDPLLPDYEPQWEDKTHELYTTIWDTATKTFLDQTGPFPIESTRGNIYIFLLYSYDANAVLVEPLQSRQARQIMEAWEKCYLKLKKAGYAPTLHVLDNEFSAIMKQAFEKHNIKYQTVAPYKHRANTSEHGIQTFKDHFQAGVASWDPDFPAKEWDRHLAL